MTEAAKSRWPIAVDSALALSLTVAWLYFCGSVYVAAFYRQLNLSGHVPQLGIESLLMRGANAILIDGIVWFMRLVLAAEIALLTAMLWAVISSLRRVKGLLRGLAKFRESINSVSSSSVIERVDRIATAGTKLAAPLFVVFVGLVILIGSAFVAENRGKDDASKLRTAFDLSATGSRGLYFSNGHTARVGPLVGCGEQVCIFLVRGGAVVLKRDNIVAELIPSRPPSKSG